MDVASVSVVSESEDSDEFLRDGDEKLDEDDIAYRAKSHYLTRTLLLLFSPPLLRSEEHTSELQSPCNLVCRLLLEKKKTYNLTMRLSVLTHYSPFPAIPVKTRIRSD